MADNKMKELFTQNYDLTDEVTSGDIRKIAELISAANLSEDSTKTDVPSQLEMSKLAAEDCALVLYHPNLGYINKFATHNKQLAELNTIFFINKSDQLPDEICKVAGSFLCKANKFFKNPIPEPLQKYSEYNIESNLVDLTKINPIEFQIKLAERTKIKTAKSFQKLSNDQFALSEKRKYPLISENTVKAAVAYFNSYCDDLSPKDRLEFASNTKLAAQKYNVTLDGSIEKYANLDPNKLNSDFPLQIRARMDLTTDTESQNLYTSLLEKSASMEPVKVAAVLRKIDQNVRIDRYWGEFVNDPILASLGITKEASLTIDGKTITKTALKHLCDKDISKWVDNYTHKELEGSDGLQVLASLPFPTRNGLLNLIN